jgi:hypothetical protein
MDKILRILVVAVALAASAGATMRATGALPWESLVVTASSLGQKAGGGMGRDQVESSGLRERALGTI